MIKVLALLASDPEGYPHILGISVDKQQINSLLDKSMSEEYWKNLEIIELELEMAVCGLS